MELFGPLLISGDGAHLVRRVKVGPFLVGHHGEVISAKVHVYNGQMIETLYMYIQKNTVHMFKYLYVYINIYP